MADIIPFPIRYGSVHFGSLPPVVTVEGYPAMPGEGHRDYARRIAKAFGVALSVLNGDEEVELP